MDCIQLAQDGVWWRTLLNLVIDLLIPWSRVLREELKVARPVKKFPAFYGTRKFNAEAVWTLAGPQ
jgi:hypothetical protein